MELDGALVHLRPPTAADDAELDAIHDDPSIARWWPEFSAAEERAELADPDEHLTGWLIEAGGEVVGYIQAWENPDPEYRHAGIDLFVAGLAQGRGIGPDAIRTVVTWLVEQRGHHRITIDPSAENRRAIRAYVKVGFRPVGVMRRYERGADGTFHDGLLMELLAEDP